MSSLSVGGVAAFISAGRFAGEVLRDPAVSAVWDRPSVLERMTVGALAGHLYLVVRRVDKHLDEPPDVTANPRPLGGMVYPRVGSPEDLDLEVHETVRRDGRRIAEWGADDVLVAYGARIAKLERRLRDGTVPATVRLGDGYLDFDHYLGSRVVELLVHADDMIASTEAQRRDPPRDSVDVALGHVVDAARRVHGDVALLRAFTRRERTPSGVPSVY